MKKSRRFVCVVLVMLGMVTSASALMSLPDSDLWLGQREYTDNGFHVLVEYAVYDTWGSNEFELAGYTNPGTGRYVYAYQLWNANDADKAVTAFQALNLDESTISASLLSGFGSLEDTYSSQGIGLEPSGANSSTTTWTFNGDTFVASKHSFFLVFSSNSRPVVGTYAITQTNDSGDGPPAPEIPEPATLAILSAGTIWLMKKRRVVK
ncbi:MAG: PEP-CTERM sorting domain-containing protein [Phycisphaerae bacterium]|nr:PEP-CTERM sorting domain-containing protein [Phycisphaerae bacterium]